ncbi:MAG: hypothetical protein WCK13_13465 [Ignavibacteriota bacterium]
MESVDLTPAMKRMLIYIRNSLNDRWFTQREIPRDIMGYGMIQALTINLNNE